MCSQDGRCDLEQFISRKLELCGPSLWTTQCSFLSLSAMVNTVQTPSAVETQTPWILAAPRSGHNELPQIFNRSQAWDPFADEMIPLKEEKTIKFHVYLQSYHLLLFFSPYDFCLVSSTKSTITKQLYTFNVLQRPVTHVTSLNSNEVISHHFSVLCWSAKSEHCYLVFLLVTPVFQYIHYKCIIVFKTI